MRVAIFFLTSLFFSGAILAQANWGSGTTAPTLGPAPTSSPAPANNPRPSTQGATPTLNSSTINDRGNSFPSSDQEQRMEDRSTLTGGSFGGTGGSGVGTGMGTGTSGIGSGAPASAPQEDL